MNAETILSVAGLTKAFGGPCVDVRDPINDEEIGVLRKIRAWCNHPEASGTKFDSTVARQRPFFQCRIGMGYVIMGLDQGVLQLSVGQVARLRVPAHDAYGAEGVGGLVPLSADMVLL